MFPPPSEDTLQALSRIPNCQCLLTSGYAEVRDGRLVERVQQCGTQPPMLLVAMEKGHPLSPLIRDSRTFAVSLLDPNERAITRIFGPERRIGDDPFLTYPHRTGVLGAPIVTRCLAWFDCEVVRHLDMETNFELYVGVVHAGGVGEATAPRLTAALNAARGAEARAPRLRPLPDRTGAAESPAVRMQGARGVREPRVR